MSLRIFIVEDHPVMREMLSDFIGDAPDIEVCGTASTGAEALDCLAEVGADLALVDVSLPGMSGIDLMKELRERYVDLPCLMLSGHGEANYVRRALEADARGYVLKGNPQELTDAIREIAGGGTYLSEPLRTPEPDARPS